MSRFALGEADFVLQQTHFHSVSPRRQASTQCESNSEYRRSNKRRHSFGIRDSSSGIHLPFSQIHLYDTSNTSLPIPKFIHKTCDQLKGKLKPGTRALSLIKGVAFDEKKGLQLISNIIKDTLDIDVTVLMGANIANEIAQGEYCETAIGYRNRANAETFADLVQTRYFKVTLIDDVCGVEVRSITLHSF